MNPPQTIRLPVKASNQFHATYVIDTDGNTICKTPCMQLAEAIATALNSHPKLVEACEAIELLTRGTLSTHVHSVACAALAAAKPNGKE